MTGLGRLLICVAALACATPAPPAPAAPPARIAVMGASVSAGFMAPRLAVALDHHLAAPHQMIDVADQLMFQAPERIGRAQVDRALAAAPTHVVAADFLFWYVYGPVRSPARLDVGLAELDRVGATPLFVGDIPDMRRAATWMLPTSIVPSPDELAAANARIAAWAHGRPTVHVLPLAAWTAPLLTEGTIEVDGARVPARSLMALDGLHPNAKGVDLLVTRIAPYLR